jgi:two-component system response regulator AtoC
MNNTESKSENNGNVSARSDSWQASRGETATASGLERAVDWSLRSHRNEAEVHAINYALQQTGWNRKRAAKLLSISYRSLLYKIRQHNISPTVEHG